MTGWGGGTGSPFVKKYWFRDKISDIFLIFRAVCVSVCIFSNPFALNHY